MWRPGSRRNARRAASASRARCAIMCTAGSTRIRGAWDAQPEEHCPSGRGVRAAACRRHGRSPLSDAGARHRQTLPLPDKPSIAVLPFTNMSGDPEQEYFSDGMADDIITELSRSRSLFVIARNSSFTYGGEHRHQAGRPRTRRALRAGRQRASQRWSRARHRAANRCGDRQPYLG